MVRSGPNKSELARLLLDWEVLERRRIELEGAIKDTVLQVGETVEVGYVVASYSSGRRKFAYEDAANAAPAVMVGKHTETVTTTTIDWRAICKEAKIEDIPFTKSAPSVRLKLIQ